MAPAIPDRWLDYKPIGERIEGTRFIAFKVPLREHITKTVDQNIRLDGRILLDVVPNLGMIIDLTNTYRYYDPNMFERKGVEHKKLMIPGHVTPPRHLVNRFKQFVKKFIESNPDNDKLIGVHCTHGVNRTGFLICNYMISEMTIEPSEAITRFDTARGHKIERNNYLDALQKLLDNNEPTESNDDIEEPTIIERPQKQRARHKYRHDRRDNWKVREENNEGRSRPENWRAREENNRDRSRSHLRADYYDTRRISPYYHRNPTNYSSYPPEQNVIEPPNNTVYRSNHSVQNIEPGGITSENISYQPRLRTDYYDARTTLPNSRQRTAHLQRHHPIYPHQKNPQDL